MDIQSVYDAPRIRRGAPICLCLFGCCEYTMITETYGAEIMDRQ